MTAEWRPLAKLFPEEGDDMGKSMTTPGKVTVMTTPGQIDRMCELFSAQLTKHARAWSSEAVQMALGQGSMPAGWLALTREHVERFEKMVSRNVQVNRTLTPDQLIEATGMYRWDIVAEVLAEMPRDGREHDTVWFFELDYDPTAQELEREYKIRGLQPDPYAVAQVIAHDPAFVDEHSVAVQWSDLWGGFACYALFRRLDGERGVFVGHLSFKWFKGIRFGGVRK